MFKVWKQITHVNELDFVEADVEKFILTIENRQNKGCLLLQFPLELNEKFLFQLERRIQTFKKFDNYQKWKIAMEFRSRMWYNQEVYDLLEFNNITLVIHDIPASSTPRIKSNTAFVYMRLHGPAENYRESYPEDQLSDYDGYIIEFLQVQKDVYIYFNNTMGQAFNNLLRLNNLIIQSQT